MPRSKQVDAYVAAAPGFARPVLEKIRAAFHEASPAIAESIKWRAPAFEYNGMLAGTAAFSKHVSLSFWKGKRMTDPEEMLTGSGSSAMASAKFASVRDMPSRKVLVGYVKEALRLNAEGSRRPSSRPIPSSATKPPDDLAAAFELKKHAEAKKTFEGFSPSNKRDYVEWITGAKRPETRARRLATTLEWLAEGKPRNWKYTKC